MQADVSSTAAPRPLRVPPAPPSVAQARRFATTAAAALGAQDDVLDRVRTLVSELVTNAVLHAGTDVVVAVVDDGECLTITVTDGSPAAPQQRRITVDSTNGRGLGLLHALSSSCGTQASDEVARGGKAVWFSLPKHLAGADHAAAADAAAREFGADLSGLDLEGL